MPAPSSIASPKQRRPTTSTSSSMSWTAWSNSADRTPISNSYCHGSLLNDRWDYRTLTLGEQKISLIHESFTKTSLCQSFYFFCVAALPLLLSASNNEGGAFFISKSCLSAKLSLPLPSVRNCDKYAFRLPSNFANDDTSHCNTP